MTRDLNDAVPTLADDALLAPFREVDAPVLTTEEVGDTVPFSLSLTADRLERLAAEGILERKSVGDGAVWWLPGHTATDRQTEPMAGERRERSGGLPQSLENAISTLSVPDERERAAIYTACYYVAEYGPATGDDLRREVYSDHPAGYDDDEEWWKASIRPAFAALPDLVREDDERTNDSDGVWRLD